MNTNVILSSIPLEQLMESFQKVARETFREEIAKKEEASKKERKRYATRKKTAEYLNCSLPTLNRWTNEGKLTKHILGGKVLYDLDEVEKKIKTA